VLSRQRIRDRYRALPARNVTAASVGLVLLVYIVAGWSGITRFGDARAYDSGAFKDYAETFRQTGRLPTPSENYEYSLPPGYPLLGAYLDRIVDRVSFDAGRPLAPFPPWLRRSLWVMLCVVGLLAFTFSERRRSLTRFVGLVTSVVAGAWAAAYLITYLHEQPWSAKVLLTFALTGGLLVVAALLAHEAWPDRVFAPALAAAATALLPAVLRIGLVFHPDPLFALLSLIAFLLVLRARRSGWAWHLAIAVGAVLGCTALVRQSAPIVILAVGAVVLLLGRRQAMTFAVVALVATLLVASPWWGYQTSRFGNPIESNLEREGYMLDHQPRSFFVSFPFPDLLTMPYRESFRNELLPKFHAELWSDWFGANHSWPTSSRADRLLASAQSVLGFGGDALVLGGLVGFGCPALLRARRKPDVSRDDAVLAALTTLFLLGWAGYVVTLVRFPQADGDPIQAHYLLFLAPVAAIFAVCAGRWAWLHSSCTRIALVLWLSLYVISFAAVLVTTFR
jgi:4-amino-4-deoxy-L-arabinose transferase-like glycosyltransferase